jgi:NAD(P)-dependent dehydrogenase (short-subunit alcohol dehydrogenase family)
VNPGLPVNRAGQSWDIACAVCYLAADDAAWVTGALLPVDGGLLVRP